MNSGFQNTPFSTNKTLNLRGQLMDVTIPKVMGILNVTPDSFYDGGRFQTEKQIVNRAEEMVRDGATFIDVGGYSSRPGAEDVDQENELSRVLPAIKAIVKHLPHCIIAVDTFRSEVAKAAVQEGACMINDISGGELDDNMFTTVAQLQVPYILMHMRGTPQTMTSLTEYDDILKDITKFFASKIERLTRLGAGDIIVDPGFGFSKTVEQNFTLLQHLEHFRMLERPLLVGLSRKSMIWRTLEISPGEALNGSTALHTIALMKGASILRVHDVKEAMQCIRLMQHL